MNINEILANIQTSLVATKDKKNDFGGYKYRSAESILEAIKPYLKSYKCTLTLDDDMKEVGGRVYVKATAKLTNIDNESVSVSAFAREAVNRKGMDDSQLTGATSSYARKYALSGLFAIDDSADADRLNNNHDYSIQQQPLLSYSEVDYLKGRFSMLNKDNQKVINNWVAKTYKVDSYLGIYQANFEKLKLAINAGIDKQDKADQEQHSDIVLDTLDKTEGA